MDVEFIGLVMDGVKSVNRAVGLGSMDIGRIVI